MKRLQVRRGSALMAATSFALIVLAACGESESLEAELEDVTRVPTMSDAAAQATREAPPPGASPEAGAGTPAAGEATPVAGVESAAATPAAQATPVAAAQATPEPAAEPAAAETVEVVSRDILFEPEAVAIPADTDVTFALPNEGVTLHNFAIDALDISVDIAPGATEEIVVNAPAGTYEYYCNVPGHKAAGMVGTLTVE